MGSLCSTSIKGGGRSLKAGELPGNPSSHRISEEMTHQKAKEISGAPFKGKEDYIEKVRKLIAEESSQSFDSHASATASSNEKLANKILMAVKKRDEVEVYGKFRDKAGRRRAPGDHFLGVVDIINKTELFKVAHKMPKGAHLHCHFNSLLLPTFLLGIAKDIKAMHIRSTLPLSSLENMERAEISFQTLPPQEPANLFDPSYKPRSWMNYQDFWRIFPGGYPKAEDWLVSKMLLTEEEVHGLDQTGKGIWLRFDACTRMMKGLFNYETAFRAYTEACIEDFINDNIEYAEIRPNFPSNNMTKDDGETIISNTEVLQIIVDALERQKQRGRYFGGMKVIYCCPRSFSLDLVKASLNECLELKQKFPNLVCGYDLVGSEDRERNPIRYYIEELLDFRRKCDELNIDLPFIFHAGETLNTGTPVDQNLFDAILLNSKRIGHGFALPKHPRAMQLVKDKGIALEICPISNEVLHLCSTIREHVLPILLANNIPCTINGDNGTFYSSTLSHDFYQVMIGSESMTLHGWRMLAEWSLQYSCLSPADLLSVKAVWLERWEKFCQWIIDSYNDHGEPINPQTETKGWLA